MNDHQLYIDELESCIAFEEQAELKGDESKVYQRGYIAGLKQARDMCNDN